MEIKEATNVFSLQFKTLSCVIDIIAKEFKQNAIAAQIGTRRDRLIKRMTRNEDPYAEKKRISNQKALEILPPLKKLISSTSARTQFRKACLCSIVGNVIEFDIQNHVFNFEDLGAMIKRAETDLAIDEIPEIFEIAKRAKEILYLTDNAGEIAFDTLFVSELRKLTSVVVAVKDKPILNDATVEDAKKVGMYEVADAVITTGTDTVGLFPDECSDEFLSFYKSADLVLAKGMGYAETLTELELYTPHALLLRTKCNPVANFFGVEKDKNLAKLISRHHYRTAI
jgi:hypothetical protein